MPGSTWMRNFAGLPVPGSALTNIPHPRSEMTVDVTFKTVRFGTIMGLAVIGPLAAIRRHHITWSSASRYGFRFGKYGALAGLAVGPALTFLATRKMPLEEIQGQCYKHRRNAQHNRVDRSSLGGALMGAVYTKCTLGVAAPGAVFGLCLGVVLGEIYHVFKDSPHANDVH